MSSVSSPRRRSPKKGSAVGSPNANVAVDFPATPSTNADEEMKDQELLVKGLSSASSGKSVNFFTGSQGSRSDLELGPAVKSISPTHTNSTIMQTSGVEICFHKLSLTATYAGKRLERKTRRILKGISGTVQKGVSTLHRGRGRARPRFLHLTPHPPTHTIHQHQTNRRARPSWGRPAVGKPVCCTPWRARTTSPRFRGTSWWTGSPARKASAPRLVTWSRTTSSWAS